MTSLSTTASSANPGLNPEPMELPFPPAPIEEMLRLVMKAARAQQLYLPNNPIYRAAIDAMRAGFTPVWKETDELILTIAESEVLWYDHVVLGASVGAKSPDNLAWLFYKDGVRELRMLKGFEENEVVTFLKLIQRARKGSPDEDDLVAMLWEADFTLLQYKYVDLLQDGTGSDVADGTATGAGAGTVDPAEVQRGTQEAVEESRASGVINMADFDATLYFLDDREIDYLHSEIQREYGQDLRANVASVLLDIFETQPDPAVRTEVAEHVHALMVFLLTASHFRGVSHLLREGRAALQRAPDIAAEHRQQLEELAEQLSAPDALSQLLQALDEAPELPPQAELAELFDELRPAALGIVFMWLSKSENERVRPLLETAAGRLAAANTAELVRLIHDPEVEVSCEAIRRAGALKAQAAVLALGKVLSEPDVRRRHLATLALAEIGSPGALQALEKAIEDSDRDTRVAAVRSLTAHAHRPALARLDAAVKGRAVREADLTEKMAFFEAYGSLCGDGGVSQLDTILNGKGFLGRREDAEVRACAAIALGRIGTSRAQDALRKATMEKDVVVRNAVSRALRGGSGT